jgi:hypothetical protein
MPKFTIKTGYRLTVADPDHPGQVLEKFGGDVVELDDDAAQQYADALEPLHADDEHRDQGAEG